MKTLKFIGIFLLIIVAAIVGLGIYLKTALPDTGSAKVIKIERSPARLARGEYLANYVAICMDCHSTRDWSLYAGPMTKENSLGSGGEIFNKEMGFPGIFYAPNITSYSLGTWTDGELLKAITTGVNKKGEALFPLMGYHRFGQMDEEDIFSIIAYIRGLKPIKKDIPKREIDFPISFLINTMPVQAKFNKIPSESDTLEYGKYLTNAAGCVDCHSKMEKGKIVAGTEFGGGMEFHQKGGVIRSANITFDNESGLGKWTKETFLKRFKIYIDSSYVPRKMQTNELNTPMPWMMYAGMKKEDIEAIYFYLKSLKPMRNEVKKIELKNN